MRILHTRLVTYHGVVNVANKLFIDKKFHVLQAYKEQVKDSRYGVLLLNIASYLPYPMLLVGWVAFLIRIWVVLAWRKALGWEDS